MQAQSDWSDKPQQTDEQIQNIPSAHWLRPTLYSEWSLIFLYLAGLILGISGTVWWLIPVLVITVGMMYWLDYIEYQRYRDQTTQRAAIVFLCLRLCCVIVATLIAPNHTSILYLLLPYRVMLDLGRKTAYAMAILMMLIYIVSHWFDPRLAPNQININETAIFCIACIWSVLKAQSILHERAGQKRDFQSRVRAEELLAEVRRSHQQLRIYAEQVATLATIEERNRVARELHDSLGHSLTAIHLQLEKALVYHAAHPQESLQSVQDARDVAREALQDVRRSVSALRTEDQAFACTREIARLGEQLRQSGLTVHFATKGSEAYFSRQILTTLYRIAQEGCTNIQRHAQATHVQISLDFSPQTARLTINDDGIGCDTFTLEQKKKDKLSYGLLGMQERLLLVNGTLQLESTPGQGTTLTVVINKESTRDSSVGISIDG